MLNPDCWIFDIDGTIADLTHRRHYVRTKPKNWAAFNAGIMADTPIMPVVNLLKSIKSSGLSIVLCSGREGTMKDKTIDWLSNHSIPWDGFYIRGIKDYRNDDIIKSELLDQILEDGWNPIAVVDDRPRVVRMWRSRGLYVFDVNQSGEEF